MLRSFHPNILTIAGFLVVRHQESCVAFTSVLIVSHIYAVAILTWVFEQFAHVPGWSINAKHSVVGCDEKHGRDQFPAVQTTRAFSAANMTHGRFLSWEICAASLQLHGAIHILYEER